ncbi:MAG: hypothetical protein HZA12_03915, partial [Nitrospirae bacterium]|nr:hypothetical protein [Nitrospirota bacterium]
MTDKISKYLTIWGILCFFWWGGVAYSASYEWIQSNWSGGPSLQQAKHSLDQTGWNWFSYKDDYIETPSSGQIYISLLPSSPDTPLDTGFNNWVSKNNIDVMECSDSSRCLKLTDYPLSFGTGKDLGLTVDGRTAVNSSDGLWHPRPVSTPTGLTLSEGGSGSLGTDTYFYRVVAYNRKGESAPVKKSYTPSTKNRSIVLSWPPTPCAEGYRIYGRGKSSAEEIYGFLASVPLENSSWTDTGSTSPGVSTSIITGGTLTYNTYYYKITAYNDNGETVVALAKAVAQNGTSVKITWSPVLWATGYKIYGRPVAYNQTYGFLATTTAATWTDTGAYTPDTSRRPWENNVSDGSYLIDTPMEFENVNVINCGSVSSTTGRALSNPVNLRTAIISGVNGPDGTFNYVATAVDPNGLESIRSSTVTVSVSGTNAVQLSWDAVAGAGGYRVYRSTSTSFSTSSLVSLCTITPTDPCTSFTDTVSTPSYGAPHINTSSLPVPSATTSSTGGSLPRNTYYYVLTAVDTSGFETIPGPQMTITVWDTTGTASVTLSWSAVSEASGYRIYRTTTSGLYNSPSLICKINNPATRSCTDTLLNPTDGTPARSYDNALAYGRLDLRVKGTLNVDSTPSGPSLIHLNGKGYTGGDSVTLSSPGLPGKGPGGGGDRGAGGGYATAGSNNSSGTGNVSYTYGDSLIAVPYPGSGGSSGSIEDISPPGLSGKGGSGGGSIKILADTMIINGELLSDGSNGGDGYFQKYADGGGGGSGGTILVGGNTVSLSKVSAAGVGGGSPASLTSYRYAKGGSGGDGRIRIASGNPDNVVDGGAISPAPYTGNKGTFESGSFLLDSGGVVFSAIHWTADVPANGGLKIQIATSKDNVSWTSFIGPDDTDGDSIPDSGSYYTISGTNIHSYHNGARYIKYKVYMESLTTNPLDSPVLYDVSVDYSYTLRYQRIESSPFDTENTTNIITRERWSEPEGMDAGADVALQLRTSTDGAAWGPWLGPRNTTFNAGAGVTTITVSSSSGFTTGSRVTLTDYSNPNWPREFDVKKITGISSNRITLDSATVYSYSSGSVFTDTYADPWGSDQINPVHRDGSKDEWLQYRAFLISDSYTDIPYLLEHTVSYGGVEAIYKPDGIIETIGNNSYGDCRTTVDKCGGSFLKPTLPGVQVGFNIAVQNDGNTAGIEDFYEVSWTTPSDVSGIWDVVLSEGSQDYNNDGILEYSSDMMPVLTDKIIVGDLRNYTLKVTPSPNAPPATKDVIVDIHSGSDYSKVDSVKAQVSVNVLYKVNGIIDNDGSNGYDDTGSGKGGTSTRSGRPGQTIPYILKIQNEGNVSDTYKLSLVGTPPTGWKVYINNGVADYDITDPATEWPTPGIPSPPDPASTQSYTLNVMPIGNPATVSIILDIYSDSGTRDSVTANVVVESVIKVDGIINGHGDDIYWDNVPGAGGFTSKDIAAGVPGNIVVGIQNEGNVADSYIISSVIPAGWLPDSVVMTDTVTLRDGSTITNTYTCPPTNPCEVPAVFIGEYPKYSGPDKYNAGEVPSFTFRITPTTFTTPSETVIFNIQSVGDTNQVDSVKAIINSRDTTPPANVPLSTSNLTATSVMVSWPAPVEDLDNPNSGRVMSYDLRYSTSPITEANFTQATKVGGCRTGESLLGQPKQPGDTEQCTVSQL